VVIIADLHNQNNTGTVTKLYSLYAPPAPGRRTHEGRRRRGEAEHH
jgi:hypothetical protein